VKYKRLALAFVIVSFAIGNQVLQLLLDKKRLKELLFKFIETYLEDPKDKNNQQQ